MRKHLLTLMILTLSFTAFSKDPKSFPSCVGDTYSLDVKDKSPIGLDDPYYPNARIPDRISKYYGQCIDSTVKRPVAIIQDDPSKNYFVVSNFSHAGRFWIAQIPRDAVESVIYQLDHWGTAGTPKDPMKGIAQGHGEIRFHLKKSVVLKPQVQSLEYPAQSFKLRDIVFSAEIATPKGVGWGVINGIKDLMVVGRLVSLEDRAKHFFRANERVSQWRLNLNSEEGNLLLKNAALWSQKHQYRHIYDVIVWNCVTASLEVMDDTFEHRAGYHRPHWTLARIIPNPAGISNLFLSNFPARSETTLIKRGLLNVVGPDASGNLTGRLEDLQFEFPEGVKNFRDYGSKFESLNP